MILHLLCIFFFLTNLNKSYADRTEQIKHPNVGVFLGTKLALVSIGLLLAAVLAFCCLKHKIGPSHDVQITAKKDDKEIVDAKKQPEHVQKQIIQVFLSSHKRKERKISKIRDALKKDKEFQVCFYTDKKADRFLANMQKSIDNTSIFVLCHSAKYMSTKECKYELDYAMKVNRAKLDINVRRTWRDGMLNFNNEDEFEKNLEQLKRQIKIKLGLLDPADDSDDDESESEMEIKTEDSGNVNRDHVIFILDIEGESHMKEAVEDFSLNLADSDNANVDHEPGYHKEDVAKGVDEKNPNVGNVSDTAEENKAFQVMLSYQWNYKNLVMKIKNDLTRNHGLRVWIDVDKMREDIFVEMAEAVEMSNVLILCMSKEYAESVNCNREFKYAADLRKDMIPLKLQKEYKHDGALGLITSGKLYIDFSGDLSDELFQEKMKQLLQQIEEKIKRIAASKKADIADSFKDEQCNESDQDKSRTLKKKYIKKLKVWKVPVIENGVMRIIDKERVRYTAEIAMAEDKKIDGNIKGETRTHLEKIHSLRNEPMKFKDIVQKDGKTCFIRGVAGVGKTSLAEYLTLLWAREDLHRMDFDFVFLIRCRDLNDVADIEKYIQKEFDIHPSELEDNGNRVLVILDGLDEVYDLDSLLGERNSAIRALLERANGIMDGHTTLVLGRPHIQVALKKHEATILGELRILEILGLPYDSVLKFIDNFVGGDKLRKYQILRIINSSTNTLALAAIPQFLTSTCSIVTLSDQEIHLERMTSLYVWVLLSLMRNHLKKKYQFPADVFKDVKVAEFVQKLSELCYGLLQQNKITFHEEDYKKFKVLAKDSPELDEIVNLFIAPTNKTSKCIYEFKHLTLQEMFAAVHCYIERLSVEKLLNKQMFEVVLFMCGFAFAEYSNDDDEGDDDDIVKLFVYNCLQPQERNQNDIYRISDFHTITEWLRKNKHTWGSHQENLPEGFALKYCLRVCHEFFASDFKDERINFEHTKHLDAFEEPRFLFINMTQLDVTYLAHLIRILRSNNKQSILKDVKLRIDNSEIHNNEDTKTLLSNLHLFKAVQLGSSGAGCKFHEGCWGKLEQQTKNESWNMNLLVMRSCELSEQDLLVVSKIIPLVARVEFLEVRLNDNVCKSMAKEIARAKKAKKKKMQLNCLLFGYCDVSRELRKQLKDLLQDEEAEIFENSSSEEED